MHDKIYEMAAETVSPTQSEQTLLDTLCTAAEAELTVHLRDDVTPASCGVIFVFSAALIAASELMLLRSVNSVEQFTAGEVSIRSGQGKAAELAASLRQQAKSLMAPYSNDGQFVFMGVQG